MFAAAHAFDVFLRGQRRMPGQDLEPVEPAVLDHQEPACAAKRIDAANRARQTFYESVIHGDPLERQHALAVARVRKRGLARSLMGTVSIPTAGSKRSVK